MENWDSLRRQSKEGISDRSRHLVVIVVEGSVVSIESQLVVVVVDVDVVMFQNRNKNHSFQSALGHIDRILRLDKKLVVMV